MAPFGALAGTVAALGLGAILLLEGATWDKVAPGTNGLGTPLGGSTQAQASARLAPQVNTLLGRPLQIRYGDQVWNTTARDLGLKLDPADLARSAYEVGRVGNPVVRLREQLATLTAGRSVAVASSTDQAALDASLSRIAREVDRSPRDAALSLGPEGSVQAVGAQRGIAVDIPASRDRVAQALASGSGAVELATLSTDPTISDDLVAPAHDGLERLLGGDQPFTLTFGDQVLGRFERADIVSLLSVQPARPGQPASVSIDDKPLRALASKIADSVNQDVQEARFQFNGGDLKPLRPSKDGRVLDEAATVEGIKAKLLAGDRSLALPIAVTKPAVSSENPAALGIVEPIDKGSTSFAGGIPEKKWNIKLAAERLNGVVVPPGGTFSFNKEVGPTTLEAGFKWGFGITGGDGGVHTVPSVAGGICQVATTLFQPVFWSGYQLEERFWHLYWIPAYTSRGVVGLDVTVDPDSNLDFKWVNPTGDYILVQTASDDASVYFSLYGKKPTWKVQVESADITNRVPADTRPTAEAEPTLPLGKTLTVETAREGFDVIVKRHVLPADGGKPRDLELHSTYQPARTVTLVGTGGKPPTADVAALIARISAPEKPAEPKPTEPAARPTASAASAAPTAAATQAPQLAPTPPPAATVAPPTPQPAATRAAAAQPTPPKPTPARPAATAKPS